MQKNNINPEKITKPLQLLASWLIGLILLVSALLTAAGSIDSPSWIPAFLSISAVVIIPLFLLLIFLLQTKYRPEMQEDSFYAKYLDNNTMTFESVEKSELVDRKDENLTIAIDELSKKNTNILKKIEKALSDMNIPKSKSLTIEDTKINELLNDTNESIDTLKKIAKLNSINLKVNTAIPQINEIISSFKTIGFKTFEEFNKGAIKLPFIISIGVHVDISIVQDLVNNLSDLGAGYLKINSISSRKKAIYIGSLNYGTKRIEINDNLIKELNQVDENDLFGEFYNNYIK